MRTEEWRTGDHEVIFSKHGPGPEHARKGGKTRRRGRKKEKSWGLKQGSCELCALTLHAYSSTASNQVLLQPNQALPTKLDTANSVATWTRTVCVLRMRVAYRHLEWLLGRVEGFGLPAIPTHLHTSSRTEYTAYRIKVALSVAFNTDHLYSQSIRA